MRLTTEFSYSVTIFQLDFESRKFVFWFSANPHLHACFEVQVIEDDGDGEVLEVRSFNPVFTVEALHELYLLETEYDTGAKARSSS